MVDLLLNLTQNTRELTYDFFNKPASHGVPLFNERFYQTANYTGIYQSQPFDYKQLMTDFKKCPEAVGIVNAIITDIFSDGYTFVSDSKSGGKQAITRAKKFADDNFLKQELKASAVDWLVLGDGALWKGKPSSTQVSTAIKKSLDSKGMSDFEYKSMVDEDYNSVRMIRHVAWSTISIVFDAEEVKGFKQVILNKVRVWNPDEIIHAMFMKLDGKVYGYSPFIASQSVVSTLALIKDLNGNFFQNGGVPDWMFILPMEMAGNPNVSHLQKVLIEKRNSINKGGSMVFTGEVKPIQLNKFDKDMEFRLLSMYYAGLLAFAFNMPIGRIQALIGGGNDKGADLSDAGYWRSISAAQDYWEDLLNSELFKPYFNVQIKFNRSYKQDEIREAQVKQFNVDYVHKLIGDLQIPVKKEWLLQSLGLDLEDVDDFSVKDLISKIGEANNDRKNQQSNSKLLNPDGKVESDKRRKEGQDKKTEHPNL